MNFSLWLKKKQRKYRLDVRDLSAGGAKIYLPFEDKSNIYKQGGFVDLLLEYPKGSIEFSAAIRHVIPLNLSRVAKASLQKLESQIHPSDQKKDEKNVS
jgi:c-di-GMP-binding flagellar brake protein YcgR